MMQPWRRFLLITTAVLAILLSLWLYWPTVRLPLIYDTLLHIRITGTLDWRSVWLPVPEFGFYRPLTFVPMLLIEQLFGRYPSWLLHSINVVQHATNVGLLIWLGWRLQQNGRFAITAGLLFALFPFSYQAVAVYGHNVHPATVGIILLGLHSYLTAWGRKQPFWWGLTLLLFFLSLLTHESAVLFGGFAALVQWQAAKKAPPLAPTSLHPRRSPWILFLALGVLYVVGYQFLPLFTPDAGQLNLNSIGLRVLYLLQAAVYPLAWLGKWLPIDNAPLIVWSGTAILLSWTLWTAWRLPQQRLALLLGAGWWLAAYGLIAVPLATSYLLHGPRLLYIGSVGVALFWAALLDAWQPSWQKPGRLIGWLLAVLFILLSSGTFIRDRLYAYTQLTNPVTAVKSTMARQPEGEGIILINLPEFLEPAQNRYPVGVEFVSMLGHYLFVEELIIFNLDAPHPVWSLVIPDLLSEAPYRFALHTQHTWETIDFSSPKQHLFLTTYPAKGPQTRHMGWVEEAAVSPPIANFSIYELTAATAAACQNQVNVQLHLQTKKPIPPGTTLFVQLFNNQGQLINQADGPPLGLQPELLSTLPQKTIVDRRSIPFATENTPHSVLVGVYNFFNGQRQPALDSQGNPLPDNGWRFPVTPCS